MLRHALALLAALALAFGPLAVSAARADCDMAGMGAMATNISPSSERADQARPCCDHGKTMSAKDCARACATACALSIVAPTGISPEPVALSRRIATTWSSTSGVARDLIPEDPPPRRIA